jgi:lipopolysaccharide transport system ATP-binding protein
VIRVEGLGKKYSLHHEQSERYTALRDVVARQARAAGRLLNPFTLAGQLRKAQREAAAERAGSEEEFWALKDVSFEIHRGERVGIIGRNGAGKSTLLKILSRITEPTTGRVEIRGRVASLLEVGTGFHPELTGRENIYLNGAILGMTRREIRAKFDEIVNFAEVEKFLDTPVKRYSSGMYVRLAFAVAAHLEPEILVVDEVLAVGDASFQKKCLGKMEDVADREGRTVLFVSHQMNAIQTLCGSCILLSNGTIKENDNPARKVIHTYLNDVRRESESIYWTQVNSLETGDHHFRPTELYITESDSSLEPLSAKILERNQDVYVVLKGIIDIYHPSLTIGYDLVDEDDNLVYRSYHTDTAKDNWPLLKEGLITLYSKLPFFLNEGTYRIMLRGGLHSKYWIFPPDSITPSITISIKGGLSESPYWYEKRPGTVAPIITWRAKSK